MARSHAKLLASVWADPDWLQLTAGAQRAFMLLLSQPKLTLVGALDYMPNRWAGMATDTTLTDIETAVTELEVARFVLVDHTTGELLIRTFARHDIATVSRNANLRRGFWNAWQALQSPWLREQSIRHTPDSLIDEFTPDTALELAGKCRSTQSEPTVPTTGSNPPSEPPDRTSFLPPPSSLHPPMAAVQPVPAVEPADPVENPTSILDILGTARTTLRTTHPHLTEPPPF